MAKFLDLDGVAYLWSKIKALIPTYLVPASKTQAGIVDLETQSFAGSKGADRFFVTTDSSGEKGDFRIYRNGGGQTNRVSLISTTNETNTVNGKKVPRYMTLRQFSYDSTTGDMLDTYETYNLPTVTPDLSSSEAYHFFTSRGTIPVENGGTGHNTRTVTLLSTNFTSSSSAVTLTNAMECTILVVCGRAGDSYNCSMVIPVENINATTSAINYQLVGQNGKYFCVSFKKSGNNMIMTYVGATSTGSSYKISRIYGIY